MHSGNYTCANRSLKDIAVLTNRLIPFMVEEMNQVKMKAKIRDFT